MHGFLCDFVRALHCHDSWEGGKSCIVGSSVSVELMNVVEMMSSNRGSILIARLLVVRIVSRDAGVGSEQVCELENLDAAETWHARQADFWGRHRCMSLNFQHLDAKFRVIWTPRLTKAACPVVLSANRTGFNDRRSRQRLQGLLIGSVAETASNPPTTSPDP